MLGMEKTTIGICDDELEMCYINKKIIAESITNIFGDDDEYFGVVIYNSADELLQHISKIDILFLDVEMPVMDGMEVGKFIVKENPECKIIISTSNEKRYGEAFRINAHRYLNKPLKKDEVEEAILSALGKTIGCRTIAAYQNRIKYNISMNEILYIKSYNGYVEIYTANNVFTLNTSLDQLEQDLDNRIFFRIHRQYIVGFKNISSVSKNTIKLINGEQLTVSKRRQSEFEKAYVEYDLNFGG